MASQSVPKFSGRMYTRIYGGITLHNVNEPVSLIAAVLARAIEVRKDLDVLVGIVGLGAVEAEWEQLQKLAQYLGSRSGKCTLSDPFMIKASLPSPRRRRHRWVQGLCRSTIRGDGLRSRGGLAHRSSSAK